MSQRFIRCPHCGLPHDVLQVFCPSTGKAIRRDKRGTMRRPSRLAPAAPAQQRTSTVDGPAAARPQRDLIGKTIGGKYVVRSVLGEGGMGTVFEAEHLTIGRSVAVKVLHPNQARKKDAVRRFHQEARAAGAIGHPNICEVYDLGTLDDGSPYLVMEKLVGETLADRIAAEGGLPFDDVIDILTQVLSGLVAAHEKGIVHRDIKPENVFLTRRVGCPPLCKLLDFGVSKMIAPLIGGEGRGPRPHAHRDGHGHALLHVARAGARRPQPRRARGPLRVRRHHLRGAHGAAAVHRGELQRAAAADPQREAAARRASCGPRCRRVRRACSTRRWRATATTATGRAADFQKDLQALRDSAQTPVAAAVIGRRAPRRPAPEDAHRPSARRNARRRTAEAHACLPARATSRRRARSRFRSSCLG